MGSGYAVNGLDLDSIFAAFVSGSKAANTGYEVAGVDFANRYAPYTSGTKAEVTGMEVNGTDFNSIFAASGSAPGPANGSLNVTLQGASISATATVPPSTIAANGGTYSLGVSTGTVGTAASGSITFQLTNATTWAVSYSYAGTPNFNGSPVTGSIPSGAVSVQYTATFVQGTVVTPTNTAPTFTTIGTGGQYITIGGGTKTSETIDYSMNVQFKNAAGTVISNSTFAFNISLSAAQ